MVNPQGVNTGKLYINGPLIKQLFPHDQKLGTLKVLARSSGCQYKYIIIQLSSIKVILTSVLRTIRF